MAHFAKLDENNMVIEVHVVSNDALDPSNEEASGIEFLTEWSGGYTNWKQTSYNHAFRKRYAGVGYRYDEVRDAFIPPKIFTSWVFDEETCSWQPPIPYPSSEEYIRYVWNEENLSWDEVN